MYHHSMRPFYQGIDRGSSCLAWGFPFSRSAAEGTLESGISATVPGSCAQALVKEVMAAKAQKPGLLLRIKLPEDLTSYGN